MPVVYQMSIREPTGISSSIKILDGDFDKVKSLGQPFLGEELARIPELDPTHMPKQVMWKDDNNGPPGDFGYIPRFSVSERAKQAIEELESGVHQFVPVEYLDQRKRKVEDRYWMVVLYQVDSVDREHTTMAFVLNSWMKAREVAQDFPELLPPNANLDAEPKIVFSLAKIGDIHLWHDRYLGGGPGSPPLMSRAMADHLRAKGLTGITFEKSEKEAV